METGLSLEEGMMITGHKTEKAFSHYNRQNLLKKSENEAKKRSKILQKIRRTDS